MDKIATLSVDPLAIAALGGFAVLVLICLGITAFVIVKATKKAGER